MENVLGYYVFCSSRGWLDDTEQNWTEDFANAAEFRSYELARDIGDRQSKGATESFYVMACM